MAHSRPSCHTRRLACSSGNAWHRTAHTALIAEILSLLAGKKPAPPPGGG
jgi:hypothetical protein